MKSFFGCWCLLERETSNLTKSLLTGVVLIRPGCAGSGKSHTLAVAVGVLKDRHFGGVYVTAPSGCAASRIAGTTLHSFAGIGLGSGPASSLVDKVLDNRWAVRRWQDCKTLVIDEISMLSGKLFDVLDSIGRACCNSKLPFGGIQLIVCGDFFQLPPIRDEGLAFQAKAWDVVSD